MGTLEDVIKNTKRYSHGTFKMGNELMYDFPRIPTGIFGVDYMTAGGFPVGVTSSIYGPPSGGKSLVLQRALAGAQNICWNCFSYLWDCDCGEKRPQKVIIITTEIFDTSWAAQLGIDLDNLVIAEADSGEHAIDIVADCIRAEDCGLVALDSLAMLTPIKEIESSAVDIQVGEQAKLIAKFLRRAKTILVQERKKNRKVSFICTNQVRAKIGGFGMASEEVPGGFVAKHDWHLTLRMSQLKSPDVDRATDLPINAKFKGSMVAMGNKRKLLTLTGTCEFFVTVSEAGEYHKGTINDYKTVMRYAEESGIVGRDPWTCMGKEFKTKGEIMNSWMDYETFHSVKRAIVDHYVNKAKKETEIR